MICPYCYQEHADGTRICPVTGKTLIEAIAVCPNCGSEIVAGVSYCLSCGEPLETVLNLSVAPSTTPVSPATQPAKLRRPSTVILLAALAVFGCCALIAGGTFLFGRPWVTSMLSGLFSSPTPVPFSRNTPVVLASTPTTTPIPTQTPIPTPSSDPTEEYIKALTATVAALSTLAAQDQGQPTATGFSPEEPVNQMDGAELALIPAGEFTMGSEPKSDPYFWGAEYPPHQVALQDYWIYLTEVTNAMYLFCVQSRGCPELPQSFSRTRPEYYGNPQFDNYPVIYVSYLGATAYCQWARGRLPTEAEWEKAARGSDGRLYPWGQDPPSIEQANFKDNSYQDTTPVGSFPAGASPYGVLDMAGNVWEWVFDWFSTDYYQSSPSLNPQGPESGTNHVIRGGSWFNPEDALRTVTRASLKPGSVLDTVGFRCAIDTE